MVTDLAPCQNAACKSYGKAHPNCKCHVFAEGGDVDHFCSQHRTHKPRCKYFSPEEDILKKNMAPPDPSHAVNGYLASDGLHGLIKLGNISDYGKYDSSISKGHKKIKDHVESLFSKEHIPLKDNSAAKQFIEDWILNGGIDNDVQQEIYKQNESPQEFAEGGEVKEHNKDALYNPMIASMHPAQNMMFQTAKGNMSNYLQSLKPEKNMPRLAFDPEPDQRQKEKSYKRAIQIASNPLHVLSEIKRGTIEPEHIRHFNSMYPELGDHLQKKLTERITEAQLNDEKPNRIVRQGLSLFMGTPLSSEFSASNIAAAQQSLAKVTSQMPPQQTTKSKKNTSKLSKSDQAYLTQGQALQKREQKQ